MNQKRIFIGQLLDLVVPQIKGPNKCKTYFQKVLEGISRRDYYSLYSIYKLSDDQYTASAVLDLSRQLIEDWISIEFMKLKGKEEMAKKFIDFTTIDNKNDMDYLKSSGKSFDIQFEKERSDEFESIKDQFTLHKGDLANSWAKCNFDMMLIELFNKKKLSEKTYIGISQAYILGNRKNHTSPIDVLNYFGGNPALFEHNIKGSMNIGLMFSFLSFVKIISEFFKEMGYKTYSSPIKKIWITFNNSLKNTNK